MTKSAMETIVFVMAIALMIIADVARSFDLGLNVTIALAIIVLLGALIVVILDRAHTPQPSEYTPEAYDTFEIHKILFLIVILSCAVFVLILVFT